MGVYSRLRSIFKKEESIEIDENQITKEVPVFRKETPDKIVETRIQPIKLPSIVDVAERLSIISHDIKDIKLDMITKRWFIAEYEDETPQIVERLKNIENNLNNLTKILSDKHITTSKIKLSSRKREDTDDISENIFIVIKKEKEINYTKLKKKIKTTDPTLSKYLHILLEKKKINKKKIGRKVYYSTL